MPDESRIVQLLQEILESNSPPEEICSNCPELLPEVQERLQKCRRAEAKIHAMFPSAEPAIEIAAKLRLGAGDQSPEIPGYLIEAVLGRGGMGVVYKARHLKLRRTVALKMMLAGPFAGKDERSRFMREAEAVAALRHEHIVQVYDVGDLDGCPYFTMEYIEGGTLAEKLAGIPQAAKRAADLVVKLAGAVQVAHRAGILHRDLKPGNVLLTADGTPKIADFGLARRLDSEESQTISGTRMGTPSYMAPEQVTGSRVSLGPAVDVYALGAILYETLTGRPPFHGETARDTERQVLEQEPVPPSRLNPRIPRDLETICLKCLHKDHSRRYATAADVSADLDRFASGKSIVARPVGTIERVVKWARRRPAVASLIATALLVIIGAVLVAARIHGIESARRAEVALRNERARQAIETALSLVVDLRRGQRWPEAQHIIADATSRLEDADSPQLKKRFNHVADDLRVAQQLERIHQIYAEPDGDNVDYSSAAREYDQLFNQLGIGPGVSEQRAADVVRASEIRDEVLAALDSAAFVADQRTNEAGERRLLLIGKLADRDPAWRDRFRDPAIWHDREQLLKLVYVMHSVSPAPPPDQVLILGVLLGRLGTNAEGIRVLTEAQQLHPQDYWINLELGQALIQTRRPAEASQYLRVAAALRPSNSSVSTFLGNALFSAGQPEQAIAAYRRAVELDPRPAFASFRLVGMLSGQGRWDEARAVADRAGYAVPTTLPMWRSLARSLAGAGRYDQAVAIYQRLMKVAPTDSWVEIEFFTTLVSAGRLSEAESFVGGRLAADPKSYHLRYWHGRTLRDLGRIDQAIAEFEKAITFDNSHGPCYIELALLLQSEGKEQRANEMYRHVVKLQPYDYQSWRGLAASDLVLNQFAPAEDAARHALALAATGDPTMADARRQLDLCNRLVGVSGQLAAILADPRRISDPNSQLAIADWASKYKGQPAASCRLYQAAFATQPALLDDFTGHFRFEAACAAAQAGCGLGNDAANLDTDSRARLRDQAFAWLKADLEAWVHKHALGHPGDRSLACQTVRIWQQSTALACVRDKQALSKLDSLERERWNSLWADVSALASRDPSQLLAEARSLAGHRDWKAAAGSYRRSFEIESTDDANAWFEYAAVQLLADDHPGYQLTCAHMIERCSNGHAMRPFLVARACTLASDSDANAKMSRDLSSAELASAASFHWSLTEQGALVVRTGAPIAQTPLFEQVAMLHKGEMSISLFERSIAAMPAPGAEILNWYWLSIVHGKLGHLEESRRWFLEAESWLDQQGQDYPRNGPTMSFDLHNWLEAQVLRREAAALIKDK
jgi:serine/threonine-protein kinase